MNNIEVIDVSELQPYENNARTHDAAQVDQIAASIEEFGFTNPILIDHKNMIVAGHGRLMAAQKLNRPTVPCLRLADLSETQIRAYILADNQLALNAGWDETLLAAELNELNDEDFDLDVLGFSDEFLDNVLENEIEVEETAVDKPEEKEPDVDDSIPENVEAKTKEGDIFKVGDAEIYQGDCLEVLKSLPENTIDSMLSDPPAGISFMGKDWDGDKGGSKEWIDWLSKVMGEAMRVLKPGAFGLVWAIPRTSHWTATALENAGFEIRDVVTHLFGSGFPKSLDISKAIDKAAGVEREAGELSPNRRKSHELGNSWKQTSPDSTEYRLTTPATTEAKQWDGWGTALKPASEHWILVRKPIREKTVAENVLKWGVGGINIDGCRIGTDERTYSINGDTRSGNFGNGANQPASERDHKTVQGRFPSNLVLSGDAPEMLDDQSGNSSDHKRISKGLSNPGNGHTHGHMKEISHNRGFADSGGASRFFYCAKPSKSERDAGLEHLDSIKQDVGNLGINKPASREARGRSPKDTTTNNNHPTVKPIRLMSYFSKLITPPNGTILDCFNGSGTTGLAALRCDLKYVGVEKELEYCDITLARLENATGKIAEKKCLN